MRYATVLSLLLALQISGQASVIHVPGDHPTIQEAISASVDGDLVLVAPGTYVENIDFLGKDITVRSEQGAGVTVIDGGSPVDPDLGSVVLFNNGEGPASILDGFTLINGSGSLVPPNSDPFGGGIFCGWGCSPLIINNMVERNCAMGAGGIYCEYLSSPTIVGNTVMDNDSIVHNGGGISCAGNSNCRIEENIISRNTSLGRDGGGIVCWYASATIRNNWIEENQVRRQGGGILIVGDKAVEITGNRILRNGAIDGAGIAVWLHDTDQLTISDNVISENKAIGWGGGFYFTGSSSILLKNNLIIKNSAGCRGGGISSGSDFTMQNCTLFNNSAYEEGGGFSGGYGSALFRNTIFWNNEAPKGSEIHITDSTTQLEIRYSDIRGGRPAMAVEEGAVVTLGNGIIDADPLFVASEGGYFYLDQDFNNPGSRNPCVNSGEQGYPVDGSTRTDGTFDHIADMGYHYPADNSIVVPDSYTSIQDAILAAAAGNAVHVRPGTYLERIDFSGRDVLLVSETGPDSTVLDASQSGRVVSFKNGETSSAVLRGFTIRNGNAGQYDPGGGIYCMRASPTLIGNTIMENEAYEGAGIYCFDGCPAILRNAIRRNTAPGAGSSGGGIHLYRASPEIRENEIAENYTDCSGAGIVGRESSAIVANNLIRDNLSYVSGGGFSWGSGSPVIENNLILNNLANNEGAGLSLNQYFFGIVRNNIIHGNAARGDPHKDGNGGGISCWKADPIIVNNQITANTAHQFGGGIYLVNDSHVTLTGNTMADNEAEESGGAIYCHDSQVEAANMILWYNDALVGREITLDKNKDISALRIDFSDLRGGKTSVCVNPGCYLFWGAKMINADPLFIDPDHGDYHLTVGSPCRDSGDNTVPDLPDIDFEGDPRVANSQTDMGADEFHRHLYYLGNSTPGGLVHFRIVGYPGKPVTLALGAGIQDPPMSTQHGDFFLKFPLQQYSVGFIPGDGILIQPGLLPSSWEPGDLRFVQALVGAQGDPSSRLTNLLVVEVE